MVTNRERFPELSALYVNNSQFQNAVRQLRQQRDRDRIRGNNARRPTGGNNRSHSRQIVPLIPRQGRNDVPNVSFNWFVLLVGKHFIC